MINYFKCVTSSSNVLGSISIQDYLNKIQYGDYNLHLIEEARDTYFKDELRYTNIKQNNLPCYALNFTFNKVRRDRKINAPTGYMYIDIDGDTDINFNNPMLYASWLSLSGQGRGALIRVKGLTHDNFHYNYDFISQELDINSDSRARKRNQVNVQSYDPNIFINPESEYWECLSDNTKYPQYSVNKKKTITTVMGENIPREIHLDNLKDVLPEIDFDGDAIYDLKNPIHYSKVKLPYNCIYENSRNAILSAIAYQIRALNPFIESNVLLRMMVKINNKICCEPQPTKQIRTIIRSVMNIELEHLHPLINATRRFIYNDIYDLSTKEKRSLTMSAINADKVKKSKLKIEKAIEEWDFDKDSNITQKSLTALTGMNKKTIEKYYPLYKSEIQLLNNEFKTKTQ